MSSVAGNLRSYFPQRQFSPSPAWIRKVLFQWDSQRHYRNSRSPNTQLLFLFPWWKLHVCLEWVFLRYHGKLLKWSAENRIRLKMDGDAAAAVSLQLSFTQKIAECLSWTTRVLHCQRAKREWGSRMCWVTRPLLGVFAGWKHRGQMQSWCQAGVLWGLHKSEVVLVYTTAGLAHDVACLPCMEMIPNRFLSSAIFLQMFVSEALPAPACPLSKSLISEEGWGDLAVRPQGLGVLCEKQPVFPPGERLSHVSAGEKRNPAEVHSATRAGADVEPLLRVGLPSRLMAAAEGGPGAAGSSPPAGWLCSRRSRRDGCELSHRLGYSSPRG